jgi:hypothetical protein
VFTNGWSVGLGAKGDDGLSAPRADTRAAVTDSAFNALTKRVAALEKKLKKVTVSGNGDILVTGVNLRIRSGSGATDGTINGKGNLIIGYDEDTGDDDKTGSHNLVIGGEHSYSSYGGLVAGWNNIISGTSASVTGGSENTASGNWASVTAGENNVASGSWSSVTGGGDSDAASGNEASSGYAWVGGGQSNTADGIKTSVSGGQGNSASGTLASVSGGYSNFATGALSAVSGGYGNTASSNYASVSGGKANTASGDYSAVSGGQGCTTGSVTYAWNIGDRTVDAGCDTVQMADFP